LQLDKLDYFFNRRGVFRTFVLADKTLNPWNRSA
jgi:hypothetical protein